MGYKGTYGVEGHKLEVLNKDGKKDCKGPLVITADIRGCHKGGYIRGKRSKGYIDGK